MRETAAQVIERLRIAWPGKSVFLGMTAGGRYTVGFVHRFEGHTRAHTVEGMSWTEAADTAIAGVVHEPGEKPTTRACRQCGTVFAIRTKGRGPKPSFCLSCVGQRRRDDALQYNRNRPKKGQ